MPINLRVYPCELLHEDIVIDIVRGRIRNPCYYYHRDFDRATLKSTYICFRNFPENETCGVIKQLAEERLKLVKK